MLFKHTDDDTFFGAQPRFECLRNPGFVKTEVKFH